LYIASSINKNIIFWYKRVSKDISTMLIILEI
jgi:hypothetical protein